MSVRCVRPVLVAVALIGCLGVSVPAGALLRPWEAIPRFELRQPEPEDLPGTERGASSAEPGVAVALLREGSPPIIRYRGVESLEGGTPIGPETRFYVASLAKTFTAAAALMLWERGALQLSDPLGRWIDDLPERTRDIRLMHLLQHTSGLPDYIEVLGDTTPGLDNARVLAFVRSLDSLAFEPGHHYAYSNTGYVVLAEVIGRASGRGFVSFVTDSILAPLGMNHTVLVEPGMPPIPHRAVGYREEEGIFRTDDVQDRWTLGSGGMYSTLGDVITWYRAVVESSLLEPSTAALLFDTPVTLSGHRSYLGMGWSDETPGSRTPALEGLRAYGSFGILGGFRSAILFYPDHGLAWIALSNSGSGALPPKGLPERLFRRLP